MRFHIGATWRIRLNDLSRWARTTGRVEPRVDDRLHTDSDLRLHTDLPPPHIPCIGVGRGGVHTGATWQIRLNDFCGASRTGSVEWRVDDRLHTDLPPPHIPHIRWKVHIGATWQIRLNDHQQ